jgi:hypothetical protein
MKSAEDCDWVSQLAGFITAIILRCDPSWGSQWQLEMSSTNGSFDRKKEITGSGEVSEEVNGFCSFRLWPKISEICSKVIWTSSFITLLALEQLHYSSSFILLPIHHRTAV